jgi:quinol monooxygenase YgiN
MQLGRRELLIGLAAVAVRRASAVSPPEGATAMYGLIGKMTAAPGKRDELIAILNEGVGSMPGCLLYIIAKDSADESAIWINEVWDNQASHAASLSLPAVKNAIVKAKPIIAGMTSIATTIPVAGHGLESVNPR